jgi:hypothetical protein
MKRTLVFFAVLLIAVGAFAQNVSELNGTHVLPDKGWARPGGGGGQNLTYLGGPVLVTAKLVMIFWGPSFSGADASYAQTLQNFRNQYGTNGEFNTITQYYQTTNGTKEFIQLTNLAAGTPDMFDSSAPPTNVPDSAVQQEVLKYLSSHAYDSSTIYEVFIPSTSYSSNGTSDSCGGPNLVYCAYHGHFSNGGRDIKYSIQPYPSCSGCHASGFSVVQDQEHFVCHETREAVTDPDLNAWGDRRGNEADDKCAWSPAPFIDGLYGYQYEWSNANSGCIKTR